MRYKKGQRWHCKESKYGDFYFIILGKGMTKNSKACRIVPDKNNPGSHHTFDSEYSHDHIKKYGVVQLNGSVDDFISIVCPSCKNNEWCTIPNVLKLQKDTLEIDNCSNYE